MATCQGRSRTTHSAIPWRAQTRRHDDNTRNKEVFNFLSQDPPRMSIYEPSSLRILVVADTDLTSAASKDSLCGWPNLSKSRIAPTQTPDNCRVGSILLLIFTLQFCVQWKSFRRCHKYIPIPLVFVSGQSSKAHSQRALLMVWGGLKRIGSCIPACFSFYIPWFNVLDLECDLNLESTTCVASANQSHVEYGVAIERRCERIHIMRLYDIYKYTQ